MKKRIIIASLAAALVLGLTACGSTTTTYEELSTDKTMELKDVKETGLAGMCEYLLGNGVIAGEPVEMKADVIGAKDGRKYGFQFDGGNVVVEVYEYDLNNLSDTAKETLESVKNNGTFTVLEQEVAATLSENGKYVLTNSDTNTDEKHTAETQKLERLFNEYANSETATAKTAAKTK